MPNVSATADYLADLKRRRAAAQRLAILPSGRAEPWRYEEPVITDQFIDGYRDACQHLLAEGLTPAPNVPVMRAMWARGGDDQRLAIRIAEAWEVA